MIVYALIDECEQFNRSLLGVYGSRAAAEAQIDECVADGFPNTSMWWVIEEVEVEE